MFYCPNCHAQLQQGDRFCMFCGLPVQTNAPQPSREPVPAEQDSVVSEPMVTEPMVTEPVAAEPVVLQAPVTESAAATETPQPAAAVQPQQPTGQPAATPWSQIPYGQPYPGGAMPPTGAYAPPTTYAQPNQYGMPYAQPYYPIPPMERKLNIGLLIWSILSTVLGISCIAPLIMGVFAILSTLGARDASTELEARQKTRTAVTLNIISTVLIGLMLVAILLSAAANILEEIGTY